MEKIKCYLCDCEAELQRDNSEGQYVYCLNCLYYRLSTGAMLFYFDKVDKGGLNRETLDKLIDYIKQNYSQSKEEAVMLNLEIIRKVTWAVKMG